MSPAGVSVATVAAVDYRDVVIEALADSEAALRDERDWWRSLTLALLERLSEQGRELQMTDQCAHVYRARAQDHCDVFLDQTDLRRAAT